MLGAFDANGNVRGVGIAYAAPFGPYEGQILHDITIRSNSAGDVISFAFYDSSEDAVVDLAEAYTFVVNDAVGDVFTPFVLTEGTTISIDFSTGWNWFSVNVIDGDDMTLNNVLASIGESAVYIKDQDLFANYYGAEIGWYGQLAELGVESMYLIDVAEPSTLEFTAAAADPADHPIGLTPGWNWIGYLPQTADGLNHALGSIGESAVYIKDQDLFANYYGSEIGWYGQLANLSPGGGYLIDVVDATDLVYPSGDYDPAMVNDDTQTSDDLSRVYNINNWAVNSHDYEFNGSMTAILSNETGYVVSEGDMLAAFSGDEVRGVANAVKVPWDDYYVFQVMMYSNEKGRDELQFKYYNAETAEVVDFADRLEFVADMAIGDAIDAFVLTDVANDGVADGYALSTAYPNPFNPSTTLEYSLANAGQLNITVYDMAGRVVEELVNGFRDQGAGSVTWNADNHSSGVYFVKMSSGQFTQTQKVVLVK